MGAKKNPKHKKSKPEPEEKPDKPKVKTIPVVDWESMREDFLIQNLSPDREEPYTYAQIAVKWGLKVETVRGHAGKNKWREELRIRAKQQSDAAIAKHQETFVEMERELRDRHAKFTRGLVAKAMVKFNSIDAESMTVDQMIKMLQFAMPEEREARGLPKLMQVADMTPTDANRQMETPALRIERRNQERKVRERLVVIMGDIEETEDELLSDDEALEAAADEAVS
jgi:hypothetical protein